MNEPSVFPVEIPVCGNPCPPDNACDRCLDYWREMRDGGYWKDDEGWTDLGWQKIIGRY